MDYFSAVISAAKAFSIPPALLLAICQTETGLKNVVAHSDGGSASFGVCQVKLNTARMFNKRVYASELLHPPTNARYAARYLAWQLNRYKGDVWCAVEAYNRGFCRFDTKDTKRNTRYTSRVFRALQEGSAWKQRRF
jgi:soluble lytic murein transglycosylase-like protein